MNQVQVDQKSYQMPPQNGFTVAHFLTVADIERSARFYETVFGGRILSRGDSSGAPGVIQIANTWLIVNVPPAAGQTQRHSPMRTMLPVAIAHLLCPAKIPITHAARPPATSRGFVL
jgi:Glyoxalase/Bleomycin resistance protein/Dioxygenase superfamily